MPKTITRCNAILLAFALVLALASPAFCLEQNELKLDLLLEDLVRTHDRVKAAEAQYQSAVHQYERAKGGWLPRVDATVEGGHEDIDKQGQKATSKLRNEETLTATQLVYDFGGTSGAIDSARGMRDEFDARLNQTSQQIVIAGITAYLRVIRAREMLKYALRSEDNMRKLSGMQEALVKRGAGYSYEELQVKGQLAGAESYRVTQERELQIARNNFKSVFGFFLTDEDVHRLLSVSVPRKLLPGNADEAISVANDSNPFLLEISHSLERLQGDLRNRESRYYPRFDAVLEGERKEQDQGNRGVRTENRATLQMTYNLFSGMQDTEDIRSVKSQITGTKRSLLDRRRTIEEQVRNAWLELTTLRRNVELYENQANITWEFLGLVKKKKAMGEDVRLLDILVGERDYISSISAKVAADIDIIIAGYNLLYQMGLITKDITEL